MSIFNPEKFRDKYGNELLEAVELALPPDSGILEVEEKKTSLWLYKTVVVEHVVVLTIDFDNSTYRIRTPEEVSSEVPGKWTLFPREFPVLEDEDIMKCVLWTILSPHADRAWANHGQSLETLADRGGLNLVEMAMIITGYKWSREEAIKLIKYEIERITS